MHLFLLTALMTAEPVERSIPTGPGKITVTHRETPLKVYTYKPASFRDGPLILVFHGVLRNAEEYRDHSQKMAERFQAIIAAPHFDLERFPLWRYQLGGITEEGQARAEAEWTGHFVTSIAQEIRQREAQPRMPYYLIGHSGGGQFVMRLAAFVKTDATRIVSANPGTQLWPNRELPFPYAFGDLPKEIATEDRIKQYLAAPLVFYLGREDTEQDEHLDIKPPALQQGKNRWDRNQRTFELARSLAEKNGWDFRWRKVEVPGVGHDHELMFNHDRCAEALFGKAP